MRDDVSTIENDEFANLSERYPEFWMLMVSGAAWLTLVTIAAKHTHYAGMAADWRHWMLMVIAMMLPLQIEAVRLTAERSLWPRRHRGILGFLVGYLSVWAVAGALLAWGLQIIAIPSRISWMEGAAIG